MKKFKGYAIRHMEWAEYFKEFVTNENDLPKIFPSFTPILSEAVCYSNISSALFVYTNLIHKYKQPHLTIDMVYEQITTDYVAEAFPNADFN